MAKMRTIKCGYCGKNFEDLVSNLTRKFCGNMCAYAARRGVRGPNYKGARYPHYKGYVSIAVVGGHSMLEHRYVMQQHLGRRLDTLEHVHHKNGIKTDNRLENLEVIPAGKHKRMHAAEDWAKQLDKTCTACGVPRFLIRHKSRGLCERCYYLQKTPRKDGNPRQAATDWRVEFADKIREVGEGRINLKLSAIAARINEHLQKIKQVASNNLYEPHCYAVGKYVLITYVSY